MPQLQQITASAGSGKTFDLTRRFLVRLMEADFAQPSSPACALNTGSTRGPCGWGDILAITFTNAAAAEMHDRVITHLKKAALGQCPAGIQLEKNKAALWLTTILRDMSALNIRTIDSLLHLIVRAAALELELHPDYTPVFELDTIFLPYFDSFKEEARRPDSAARQLLQRACEALVNEGGSKGFVVGNKLIGRLSDLMEGLLVGRFGQLSSPEILKAKREEIQQDFTAAAQGLLDAATASSALWNAKARAAVQAVAGGQVDKSSTFFTKETAQELFHKDSPVSEEMEAAFARLRTAAHRQAQIGALITDALQQEPLVQIAQELIHQFRSEQGQQSFLPSVLAPQLAAQVLEGTSGVPEALCRMGTRLTHYLMDEFQDTSREQWAALLPLLEEALSRGGSLTWVGDVKQSIYGWRGGDPSLFDEVLHTPSLTALLGPEQGSSQTLKANWRSREEIIRHTNTLFAPLKDQAFTSRLLSAFMPSKTPVDYIAQATVRINRAFADVIQENSPQTRSGGLVRVEDIFLPPTADGEWQRPINTAERQAATLQRLCRLLLDDIGHRHPWSHILVLVRANEDASRTAEGLVAQGIPVITENSLLLAEHPLVVQSVALLSFLNDPQDDIAFWTLVTGCIILEHPAAAALNFATLHDWRLTALPDNRELFRAFRQRWPQIWRDLLEPFYNQSGLMTPYDILLEWYKWLSVEERYPQHSTFLRRFMEVLHSAEEKGLATLPTFLEYWQKNHGAEKIPMPENMDAVRIMTIHKAKGLEAPVVILPDTSITLKGPASSDLTQASVEGLNMVVHLRPSLPHEYYSSYMREACESLDLLYVALTRARDELYIFHTRTQKDARSLSTVLEMLWQESGLLPDGVQSPAPVEHGDALPSEQVILYSHGEPEFILDTARQDALRHSENTAAADLPLALPALSAQDWRPMQWLPRLKIFRNTLAGFSFKANDRGSLLHFCLEHLHITGQPEEDARRALRFGLDHFYLPVPDDAALHASLHAALCWFAGQPHAGRWLSEGSPEQSLLDADGHLKRMDLLVQEDWGTLVIDYKSGQPCDEHLTQVRDYLQILADSGQSRGRARGLLIYLDLQQYRLVDRDRASDLAADLDLLLAEEAGQ